MKPRSVALRQGINNGVVVLSVLASLIGIIALVWILSEVIYRGIGAFNWAFFTQLPAPAGEGGGIANAILGTIMLTVLATLIGVPIGLFAGVFLA